MKITELHVKGYRSLVDVSLTLRPLTVMIGPNGSGKTALIEVFRLLRDAAQENLSGGIEKLGGLDAMLSRISDGPDRLKIGLSVNAESARSQEPINYRFEVGSRAPGYVIQAERLEWQLNPTASTPFLYIDGRYGQIHFSDPDGPALVSPTWDYNRLELALAQVPRMYDEPEALRTSLTKIRSYSFLDVRPRAAVRLPQSLTPTVRPGPNGENLFSALYNLRASQFDDFNRIEEILGIGFPGFRKLEFPVVGAGQVTMTWHQEFLKGPLYPNELSEGMLRFLWLVTILLSPPVSSIILIDEPEVSLHPELLKLLAGVLQDTATRQQIIVATHSPDLIRWLNSDEVLVLDKLEGQTQFTWADSLELEEWLKEYTLRDLWLMGTLGGRP